MLANKSILKTDFKPLEAGDLVVEVIDRMEVQRVKTLPVVDKTTQKLVGQVKYAQLIDTDNSTMISDLKVDEAVKVYKGQHIFEAARLMLQHELQLLPMVDKESTFLGIITKERVLESISEMLNLVESGSVITIELEPIDFSISEIVQIIETEGAKILGVTVEGPNNGKQNFEISVKLNVKDTSRVTAALKRYDYAVLIESESTVFGNDLEHRADELLKYIDM